MKNGPLGKVLKCKKCQLRVHAGRFGLVVQFLTMPIIVVQDLVVQS